MSNQTNKQVYWCLDFDRCLGNVDVLFAHYVAALEENGLITPSEVSAARQEVEATKGSFDLIGYLRHVESISDEQLLITDELFIDKVKGDSTVRLPGAADLLAFLASEHRGAFGIMTYGDPHWQLLKIKAAGLANLPRLVVSSPHKAREISTWYDAASQSYRLPTALAGVVKTADEVVLVDDKIAAFEGMHVQTRGYWVYPIGKLDEATRRSLSVVGRVVDVAHLGDIIRHEQLNG
jgi:FMN phosphatase YigB (HAD superfamily)